MITMDDVITRRKELRRRKRYIFNDDGAAITHYKRNHHGYPLTSEKQFVGANLGPFFGVGNSYVENPPPADLTTIVLDTDVSGTTSRNSNIVDIEISGSDTPPPDDSFIHANVNLTRDLINQFGKDGLQIIGEHMQGTGKELFFGIRVNDRHDTSKPRSELNKIKQKLWDSGGLIANGVNNGLNYARPDAYNTIKNQVLEVINSDTYLIDGICLDFYRHLGYFKNVSAVNEEYYTSTTQEQIDIMTSWLSEIVEAANIKSVERMSEGLEPLLIMVKGPDDPDFARMCALDVNKWFKEDLVDTYVPIGYHQINLIQESVAWIKSYGVQACPSTLDVRLTDVKDRLTQEGHTAQICKLLGVSPDGFELFNYGYKSDYHPNYNSPSGWFYRCYEDGSVFDLSDRRYYVVWTNQNTSIIGTAGLLPNRGYADYKFPQLSTESPSFSGGYYYFEIYEPYDKIGSCTLQVFKDSLNTVQVTLNGHNVSLDNFDGSSVFGEFSKTILKWGVNKLELPNINEPYYDACILINR